MSAIENEQTKLLAANIDRASSAFIIVGFVTPVVALSYQIPTLPPVTLVARPCPAEAEDMTFLEGYVLFGIPILDIGVAYAAVRLHEWDLDRRQPPGE